MQGCFLRFLEAPSEANGVACGVRNGSAKRTLPPIRPSHRSAAGRKSAPLTGTACRDMSRAIVPHEGVTLALNSAAIVAIWQQRVPLNVPSSKAYGLVQPLSIFGEILMFQYGEIFTLRRIAGGCVSR